MSFGERICRPRTARKEAAFRLPADAVLHNGTMR